ncbi:MAG: pantoate--beta-alanine ligase [Thermoanaerobaculia bacterium]
MKEAHCVADLRGLLAPLRRSGEVSFVPTMGALHEGHLSLVRRARREAPVTVVSIFVNPIQFGPGEDFEKYPRSYERDLDLLAGEGTDVVFAPRAEDLYPEGFSTKISVSGVSERLEGAVRPDHFAGVATVVAKLFHAVEPASAVFGRKDLQQCAVVRRMIADLEMPVRLVVAPISREADGLARSSRNAYLTGEERARAPEFSRALLDAAGEIRAGEDPGRAQEAARRALGESGFGVDYLELVDPVSMELLSRNRSGAALVSAVRLGKVRLLDNVLIEGEP